MNLLRWIMLVPISVLALMAGSFLGGVALSVFGQNAADVGSGFFGPFSLVFAACAVAPGKRANVGRFAAFLIVVLALGTVVLSKFNTIPEFYELSDVEKTVVPVFQVIGAIYAMFISLPVVYKSATAEDFGRELAGASSITIMLGLAVGVVGVVSVMFGGGWLALIAGMAATGLGAITWMAAPISALVLSRSGPG